MVRAKQLSDAIKAQPERELAARVFNLIVPVLTAEDLDKLGHNLLKAAEAKKREELKNERN